MQDIGLKLNHLVKLVSHGRYHVQASIYLTLGTYLNAMGLGNEEGYHI